MTASDLTPLSSLPVLRHLVIKDAPKIENLEWIKGLTHIKSLGLENLREVDDIEPLSELNQLSALGIEGSMWTSMRIGSLKPLAALKNLEYLFLTNLRVRDRSLHPIYRLDKLRVLECAKFYPREEFDNLSSVRPGLRCSWFRD